MSAPLLLLLPWLVAPRAQAQASQASPVDPVDEAEVPVLYRPVTELREGDFPGLDIDGELVRPADLGATLLALGGVDPAEALPDATPLTGVLS